MTSIQKKQFTRITFLIIVLAAFVGLYMYNDAINSQEIIVDDVNIAVQKIANKELDTEVLDDDKFKDLKQIPLKEVGEREDNFEGELTEDEQAKLKMMARYSNPFIPFN